MTDLRERVEALPGMHALLPALEGLAPAYLVGGAVRDLLRGGDHVDLDVALEGDAREVARTIAERLGGEAREHERFGTATVRASELTVDLATTRRERYPHPGALPEVEPAPLAEDLARRDFTINAMAVGLSGADLGLLHDPHGGRTDLEARLVRVLHERSFVDDPTRLLRAVRYAARLAGAIEERTYELARNAITDEALETVSGARIRDELLDLLGETEMPAGLELMRKLWLDAALHPRLRADPDLAAGAALASGEVGADRVLAAFAALISPSVDDLIVLVDRLALPRERRERATAAARQGPLIAHELTADAPPSRIHRLLEGQPEEALAMALALGAPGEQVLRWVSELRHVTLEITGDDLIDAGVPPSPAVGRALEETLMRKLDGEISGREQELASALAIAREES